ncbi:hypothetical protein TSMEX_006122 [Taenia solium]|eukprot:TsM_001235200 transcript=TsM_001235200 gene=TsM_001235200
MEASVRYIRPPGLRHYNVGTPVRLLLIGSMRLASCLCIISFIFTLLFHPVLSQIVTNDSDAQKSKRSPPSSFGLGDLPTPGGASSINWRFSLGNINSTHVNFAPSAPRPSKRHFRNKGKAREERIALMDAEIAFLSFLLAMPGVLLTGGDLVETGGKDNRRQSGGELILAFKEQSAASTQSLPHPVSLPGAS